MFWANGNGMKVNIEIRVWRERERVKDEDSMRVGKERKTDVSKLYAYNECEHSVACWIKSISWVNS